MKKGKCILMCAGEYHPCAIKKAPDDFVIAVDGGLKYLMKDGPEPDFLLGDFDSAPPECDALIETYRKKGDRHFLRLPVEKDETDTLAAVKLGYEMGYREFEIYGGMGKRLDHTMANIQVLVWLSKRGAGGWLLDGETSVTVIGPGMFFLPESFAGTVSLFALEEELFDVSIRGLKYNLSHATIRNDFPIGCSNETTENRSEKAAITIGRGTGLLILTKDLINRHH
ncbi:MAG TPA: thiamine diphosphokinase [Lachnospiraceae bacterium]|nr:thiamine diphosphokinase [Lachnospiraceae bacterium]